MPEGATAPIIAEPGNADWEALCHGELGAGFEVCDDRTTTFFMATGGTTGMPKAVMWPCGDFWQGNGISSWSPNPAIEPYVATSLEDHVAMAAKLTPDHPESQAPMLLLCPLMHGTA